MSTEISTKVMLKNVRFSYANLFEPKAIEEGGDKKYSTAILISKDSKDNVEALQKVIDALTAQVKAGNKGKLPLKFKTPLRDGDEEKPDDENYTGMYFINANSASAPGVVGTQRDEQGKPKPLASTEFKSGDYGHVTVNLFPFSKAGNNGIGVGLNNVMKTKDGAALAGKSSAADDFKDIAEDEEENWD